jgi:hypothetical protein
VIAAIVAPVRRVRVPCLVVAACGLIAYAASRDHFWDARHPLAYRDEASCAPLDEWLGPIVEVKPTGTTVEHDPNVEHILRAKRSVWKAVHPGRAFDMTAYIVADADPTEAIAKARRAGYSTRVLVRQTVPPVGTRTLGALERSHRYCAR